MITNPDPKPGVLTSEFWLTALPLVGVMVLLGVGSLDVDDAFRLWPLFTGGGLYSIGRGIAKARRGP